MDAVAVDIILMITNIVIVLYLHYYKYKILIQFYKEPSIQASVPISLIQIFI